MALDPELFDTYKSYKIGTAKLVYWLATAARKTQLVEDLFLKPETKTGTGRLKGKARAAQKIKDKTKAYEIRLADFTRLAEALAIKATDVPDSLIRTLEEIIAARRNCTGFYEQCSAEDALAQASNARHRHFISILQETYRILKPLVRDRQETQSDAKIDSSSNSADVKVAELDNLFEYLEIEEPAEWTSTNLPKSTQSAKNATYEFEHTYEDVSFAIFCLFKDLTDIRAYVRQVWAEYRESRITFTTAAVTSNTAISIFRRLNEDFLVRFPEFDDHGNIIQFLYDGYCDPHNASGDDFATYTGAHFKLSANVFFCANTHELIAGYFMRSEIPFHQNVQADRAPKEDIILLRCLSHLGVIQSQSKGQVYHDQLIEGLYMIKRSGILFTWVVFAVQLMIDTRRVVGEKDLDRCLSEAQQLQKWMCTALDDAQLCGLANTVNSLYNTDSNVLSGLRENINNSLGQDWVQNVVDQYLGDRANLYPWGSYLLVRNCPMLLGLMVQDFLAAIHQLGVWLGGEQAAVVATVHLYNIAQQSSQVPKELLWSDLEQVIEWQGCSSVFIGDRPKDAAEAFRRWNFVMGVSTIAMGRDRRGRPTYNAMGGIPQKKGGARRLNLMSQYCKVALTAGRGKIGAPRWTLSTVSENPFCMMEQLIVMHLESTHLRNRFKRQPKLNPLSMLATFRDCLKADEIPLRFDMISLNQYCVELLRKVQAVCIGQSPLDYPQDKWGGERNTIKCFTHMLAGVAGLEHAQPTRFSEASVMVKERIEVAGNVEYSKAKSRCFVDESNTSKVTDDFKTPVADEITRAARSMFNLVIVDDGGVDGPRMML